MHVVMLSDHERTGGAAIAQSRLAEGLVEQGVRVTRLVKTADGKEHAWKTIEQPMGRWKKEALRLLRYLQAEDLGERLAAYRTKGWLKTVLTELSPDIINVHNLHSAFGWRPELLATCVQHAPTVWTLHDMWSFTGRCAYSADCRKFLTGCDSSCPTPQDYPALKPKRIAKAWRSRERLLAKHPNLAAVCPSRWLAEEALNGLWQGHRVEVIPNGLPLDLYQVLSRDLAREALGIKTQAPVVLTVAQKLSVRRKGGEIIVAALHGVSEHFTLLTLGEGKLQIEPGNISLHPLGYIDHERTKVLAYNAADLLVHPAPVDNLPNVVMEAIACGTPVVGFAAGGVKEMVRPGQTGWLADIVSADTLAEAINRALSDLKQGMDLRQACRSVAEAEYSVRLQAKRYIKLFSSLMMRR